MKIIIEPLNFPSEIKNKLKIKAGTTNLKFQFLSGHIIKFNKTNLSLIEPHKIIVSNNNNILIALFYDDSNKVYIPNNNIIISFTKYVSILNKMNKL